MIKSKKQSFIVIGVFALVLMLGTVTYAFFNYTRTGTANTIRTGRIYFNTSQSNTLNLTNVFPMSASDAGNANLDAVSIRIWGDTTYADGEEFEISIVDVNNTVNNKTIPINYIASYSATPVQSGDPNVIGESSDSYFTARGSTSAIYQLSATGEATNGEQVLIGFIPSGATGVDGTLTIKAYLDSSKISISDTYNASEPETDTNGTTIDWVAGRTVLTTTEWNALQNTQTPLSFKIKAVSQEGIWVEEPVEPFPTLDEMCPNCVFIYDEDINYYTTWNTDSETPTTITNYSNDYHDVITDRNIFIGVILNGDKAERAFACSTIDGNPFCLEGTANGLSNNQNRQYMQRIMGEMTSSDEWTDNWYNDDLHLYVTVATNGGVDISSGGDCVVHSDGRFGTYTS